MNMIDKSPAAARWFTLPQVLAKRICLPLMVLQALVPAVGLAADLRLLNASYDPTRELYQDVTAAFTQQWQTKNGGTLKVQQSHGGSGKQARAVIDGLPADVVTLALAWDIDAIAQKGLIARNWQQRLPNQSSPYTSTIVFVVRKGNPKAIRDWGDLVRPGVQVITPSPKASGAARWAYLAAWGWASQQYGRDTKKVRAYMQQLYANVPVLDTGARAATLTFLQRNVGDVLLAWENEALLIAEQLGKDQVEIVAPSVSILAEPPVAVVDTNADKHGTRAVAEAFLRFLYTPQGQQLAAKHGYRPRDAAALTAAGNKFRPIKLYTLQYWYGDWQLAHSGHFAEGAAFDQILAAAKGQ
jgi:sulfate/thiosulfate-binding protein